MKKGILVLLGLWAMAGAAFAQTEAPAPLSVVAGTGKVQFNANIQTWYLDDTSLAADSNFRIRRAELKFSGSVVEHTRWFAMIDAAKSLRTGAVASTNDNKVLQDIAFVVSPIDHLELMLGQFKLLTTAEGLDSSTNLLMPERSLVGRTYGDRREPGFLVNYTIGADKGTPLSLGAMVSNGGGPNVDDTTVKKDLTIRADLTPVKGVNFGAFTWLSDFKYSQRGRVGANVRYLPGAAVFRAEYVEAKDLGVRDRGVVAEAGYTFAETVQPVVRYELLKSVESIDSTFWTRATSVGANYFILKNNAKIQAAYTMGHQNFLGNGGSYAASRGGNGNLFILSFQGAI